MLRPHAQGSPQSAWQLSQWAGLAHLSQVPARVGQTVPPTHCVLGPFYKRWKRTHKPNPVSSWLRLGAPLMPFYTSCHHRRSVVTGSRAEGCSLRPQLSKLDGESTRENSSFQLFA